MLHLEDLQISQNQITSLPQEIGDLGNLYSLNIYGNLLTNLPDSIVKLKSTGGYNFGKNCLHPKNLSQEVILWLEKNDPDWRYTQNVPIISNTNINTSKFSINIKNSLIQFNLPTSGYTKLQIYNMKGRLLSTLVGSYKHAGKYDINWDRKSFGAGFYYIKLSVGESTTVMKAVFLR